MTVRGFVEPATDDGPELLILVEGEDVTEAIENQAEGRWLSAEATVEVQQ